MLIAFITHVSFPWCVMLSQAWSSPCPYTVSPALQKMVSVCRTPPALLIHLQLPVLSWILMPLQSFFGVWIVCQLLLLCFSLPGLLMFALAFSDAFLALLTLQLLTVFIYGILLHQGAVSGGVGRGTTTSRFLYYHLFYILFIFFYLASTPPPPPFSTYSGRYSWLKNVLSKMGTIIS